MLILVAFSKLLIASSSGGDSGSGRAPVAGAFLLRRAGAFRFGAGSVPAEGWAGADGPAGEGGVDGAVGTAAPAAPGSRSRASSSSTKR